MEFEWMLNRIYMEFKWNSNGIEWDLNGISIGFDFDKVYTDAGLPILPDETISAHAHHYKEFDNLFGLLYFLYLFIIV